MKISVSRRILPGGLIPLLLSRYCFCSRFFLSLSVSWSWRDIRFTKAVCSLGFSCCLQASRGEEGGGGDLLWGTWLEDSVALFSDEKDLRRGIRWGGICQQEHVTPFSLIFHQRAFAQVCVSCESCWSLSLKAERLPAFKENLVKWK